MIKVKKIVSGALEVNCYIVYDSCSLNAAIIDPGEDGAKVISQIEDGGFKPEMLINTHGHYDHILSDEEIRKKYKIPLAVHKDEAVMLKNPSSNASIFFSDKPVSVETPEILLSDGDEIKLSFASFKVIHAPGHTKGGICLLFDGFVFTGDTLFAGTVGRTDLPEGDYSQLLASLEKLKKLNPSIVVYPGHGSITTMANELRHNPFLNGNVKC